MVCPNAELVLKTTVGPEKDLVYPINASLGIQMTRVVRGGNFRSKPDREFGNELRLAYRNFFPPGSNQRRVGLRCVRGNNIDDPLWHTAIKIIWFPKLVFFEMAWVLLGKSSRLGLPFRFWLDLS